MKLENFKDIIDEYFDKTPTDNIIKRFEALGYEFEDVDSIQEPNFKDISDIGELNLFGSEFAYTEDNCAPVYGSMVESIEKINYIFNSLPESLAIIEIDYKEIEESAITESNREFAMAA